MDENTSNKLDRLITLLEDKEESAGLKRPCHKALFRDVIFHTILASAVGYFMFRILDYHLGAR